MRKMNTNIVQVISALMLGTILIGTASPPGIASASVPATIFEQDTDQPAGPTDPHEMEAFLDNFIPAQLEEDHIPGAAVSIVKDGELFFAKGYGFADLETQRPVTTAQTLFGIGSTSKLFTWTAVMQLWEQGKVDLNADINTYLKDFQIPATNDQPITLAHLLTHTAGFEERNERMFITNLKLMIPLSDYLARYVPKRIYAPGEVVAYSNYGTALAAYIVEEVSGQPFEQYSEENIFTPLEMTHTTLWQPLPPELVGDQAIGYQYMDGDYKPLTWWIQGFPAGSAFATASDMAQFMIAHLQDGQYKNIRILQADTAQEMHHQHFTQDPRVSGIAYGFLETPINGQHIIGHAGGRMVYFTGFVLLPEHNVGLFVSYNGSNGERARERFIQAFMDHYYPGAPVSVPQPKPDFADRAKRFVGSYQNSRHNGSTFEKLNGIVMDTSIKLTSNNTFETGGYEWVETEDPLVFIREDGHEHLIFQEDEAGNITNFMFQNVPVHYYFKKSWLDTATFTLLWGGVSLLVFLLTVLIWPIKFLASLRRRKQTAGAVVPLASRIALWLAWGLSALSLFFFVMLMIGMFSGTLVEGRYAATGFFLIPPLTALMAIGMLVFTGLAWLRRYWSLSGRMYYTLLTVAAVVFLGWLNYFNLISLSG